MDGSELWIDSNKIVILHNQAFVAHALSQMLKENGFGVQSKLPSDPSAGLNSVSQADLFIVGSFKTIETLQRDCHAIHDKYPTSKIALVDAGFAISALQAARTLDLDAYLSLELQPELILQGLRLALAGTQCFPKMPDTVKLISEDAKDRGTFGLSDLTPRECEVLRLVSSGAANKVIAWKLSIAEGTVKAHINSVLRKTDLSNRTEAARWAINHGLIENMPTV